MKRSRNDPNEYLGGDLNSSISFVESGNGDERRPATKKERNEQRRKANKEWKLSDRLVDSGKDPNPRHTLYYKQQLPCLEIEWDYFQTSLCTPLPVTFRFGGSCPKIVESSISKRVADEFRTMRGRYVEINGKIHSDNIVKPISWCRSFQIAADSATLARSEALSPLYEVLCREVTLGNIVRQELASMIPVLLLDVHHNHTVLDVCAAPGSKTEQILAAMQQHGSKMGLGSICSGMVVANDADPKRILTLKKRYSRCGRPNLLINCSRAEDLYKSIKGKFKFDRIVADVPCSGDGTFRKFPHLWRLFRPRISLELHLIQLQIAKASALMLKAGGRMIYSTCSINPLEDEAVVAALLLYCGGRLKLVDVEKEGLLPGLKKRAGISSWICDDDVFTIGEENDEARQASKSKLSQFALSMFPPAPEVAAQLHLDRCVRILPHDQDTGGFFVAVLEMISATENVVPFLMPTPIGPLSIAQDVDEVEKMKTKKEREGISEKKTLETFKQLGFNAKSRQKEKEKMKNSRSKGNKEKVKLDSTACTMYESLGSSFGIVKEKLNLEEKDLCSGLLGLSLGSLDATDAVEMIDTSAACCLVIASEISVPEIAVEGSKGDGDEMGEISKAEEEKIRRKKLQQKSRDSNGIFGSRSTGWLKVQAEEERENFEGPYKMVQLVSQGVENALRIWARSDMVIQAGVTVCQYQESSGSWRLEPDGARALLPHMNRSTLVLLSPADFSFFLQQGLEKEESVILYKDQSEEKGDGDGDLSVGVEIEESNGNIVPVDDGEGNDDRMEVLSTEGRVMLWKECERRLELLDAGESSSHSFSLVVGFKNIMSTRGDGKSNSFLEPLSSAFAAETGSSQPKRRLSKAERKSKKSNLKATSSSAISTEIESLVLDDTSEEKVDNHSIVESEREMVIVISVSYKVVEDSYEGIRLEIATPADVCESYGTAISSLKL